MTWLYFPHFQLDVPIEPFTWCDWTDEALVKKVVINISLELKDGVEYDDISQIGGEVVVTKEVWSINDLIHEFGKQIHDTFNCVLQIEWVNEGNRLCVQDIDHVGRCRISIDGTRIVERL